MQGEISVKPTQLGLDHDADACLAHLVTLANDAAETGSYLWVDMEGSAYTESTIVLYERLRAVSPETGICLQAYLRRTAADIARLLPLDPAIRLVKGAYDEPEAIAFRDKSGVDSSFAGLADPVPPGRPGAADQAGPRHARCRLIEQIAEQVGQAGVGRDGYEVQMLYGIREDQQKRLQHGRVPGPFAHRVRRALVSVVHAAARRAPGQRLVRAPPDDPVVARPQKRREEPACLIPDAQLQTQIRNIESSTGRSLDEWVALVERDRHDEARRDRRLAEDRARDEPRQRQPGRATALRGRTPRRATPWSTRSTAGRRRRCVPSTTRCRHSPRASATTSSSPRSRPMSACAGKQFATVGPASGWPLELGLNLKDVNRPAAWRPATGCAPTGSGWPTRRVRCRSRGLAARGLRPGLSEGRRVRFGGPVAQRQSTGLLIPWSWVRIPPGSPNCPAGPCPLDLTIRPPASRSSPPIAATYAAWSRALMSA